MHHKASSFFSSICDIPIRPILSINRSDQIWTTPFVASFTANNLLGIRQVTINMNPVVYHLQCDPLSPWQLAHGLFHHTRLPTTHKQQLSILGEHPSEPVTTQALNLAMWHTLAFSKRQLLKWGQLGNDLNTATIKSNGMLRWSATCLPQLEKHGSPPKRCHSSASCTQK